jgi:hypothetical protein
LYSTLALQSRLLTSSYPLAPDVIGLLESSPLLEGNYFNNWFLYYYNINYSPLDYDISTLSLMTAWQSRLFSSWYPLTQNGVGLLESSTFLEGNYFNNWFLYYFNINYSPLDYYISTLYLKTAMLSRLFPSWYSLTHDAVGLLESSPLLEGNYFNNWFLWYFDVNYSPLDCYISTLYLMMTMYSRLFASWYPIDPLLDCWNLLLYWKAIILITGSYIILISITVH